MNPPIWTVPAAQNNARGLLKMAARGEIHLPKKTLRGLEFIARGEKPPEKEEVQ